jgi:zinc transport system substrate-binding protein
MNAVGSLTISPERSPGVKRLYAIREKIVSTGARCVFAEPQFAPALIVTVLEGTQAKTGTLDPIGAAIPPGPDAYFTLLENLAAGLRDCLDGPG